MGFKKLMAVTMMVTAMSLTVAPSAMAAEEKAADQKQSEAKGTDPITGLFTGVAGLLDGILQGIGSLFTGGK